MASVGTAPMDVGFVVTTAWKAIVTRVTKV
jgi:hypothetical protein